MKRKCKRCEKLEAMLKHISSIVDVTLHEAVEDIAKTVQDEVAEILLEDCLDLRGYE